MAERQYLPPENTEAVDKMTDEELLAEKAKGRIMYMPEKSGEFRRSRDGQVYKRTSKGWVRWPPVQKLNKKQRKAAKKAEKEAV